MKLTFSSYECMWIWNHTLCISHLFTFEQHQQKESYNSLCNRLFILLMDKYQWSVTFETRDLLKNVWEFNFFRFYDHRFLIFLANQWSFNEQKTINGPMLFWLLLFHMRLECFYSFIIDFVNFEKATRIISIITNLIWNLNN